MKGCSHLATRVPLIVKSVCVDKKDVPFDRTIGPTIYSHPIALISVNEKIEFEVKKYFENTVGTITYQHELSNSIHYCHDNPHKM